MSRLCMVIRRSLSCSVHRFLSLLDSALFPRGQCTLFPGQDTARWPIREAAFAGSWDDLVAVSSRHFHFAFPTSSPFSSHASLEHKTSTLNSPWLFTDKEPPYLHKGNLNEVNYTTRSKVATFDLCVANTIPSRLQTTNNNKHKGVFSVALCSS